MSSNSTIKTKLASTFENRAVGRRILLYASLYGTALLFLVPYIYMFSTSIQTRDQAVSDSVQWIPWPITFDKYTFLISETMIVQWTVNTVIIAGVSTLLILLVDSLIAFSLTRLDWPGQKYVLALIVASFMVPGDVNIIPLYQLMADLGLVNHYLAVILPAAAAPLGVFMLVQFFREIPDELEEAARLDGFSTLRIYTHIILPLSKSVMTALGLFVFIWNWNNFTWPLVVLQREATYTLPIGLVTLYNNLTYQPVVIMASAVIASAPLIILFLIFQKHLISAVEFQGVT